MGEKSFFYAGESSDYYYHELNKLKREQGLANRILEFFLQFVRDTPTLVGYFFRRILCKLSFRICGRRFTVHPYVVIKHPLRMEVGHDCTINPFSFINALQGVKFGNKVCVSSHCSIISQVIVNEKMKRMGFDIEIKEEHLKPIEIGDNTDISIGCLIGPGVKIGKDCIIGANSVVLIDIPDGCFAAGSPAKVIKKIKE